MIGMQRCLVNGLSVARTSFLQQDAVVGRASDLPERLHLVGKPLSRHDTAYRRMSPVSGLLRARCIVLTPTVSVQPGLDQHLFVSGNHEWGESGRIPVS